MGIGSVHNIVLIVFLRMAFAALAINTLVRVFRRERQRTDADARTSEEDQ